MSASNMIDLLWNHLFQVTVVALAAAVLVQLFARKRPHLAHAFWGLVLLKCVTPPIIASPTGLFTWIGSAQQVSATSDATQLHSIVVAHDSRLISNHPNATNAKSTPVESQTFKSSWWQATLTFSWQLWSSTKRLPLQTLWLLGSVLMAAWFASRLGVFLAHVRSHSRGQSADLLQLNQQMQRRVNALGFSLGIRRSVRVRVLDALVGPAIIGLFRPCVVLPKVVVQALSKREIDALLAHEMVHFRRGDLWWSLIQALSLITFWCNPLIWFASRKLTHETELCCDEETIASLGIDSAAYANCLIAVLEQKHSLKAAPMLPGVRPIEVTSKRLEKIMRLGQGSHSRCPSWIRVAFIVGAAVALPGLPFAVAQTGPLSDEPTENLAAAQNSEPPKKLASAPTASKAKAIRYEIQIVELPTETISEKLESWQVIGSTQVITASPEITAVRIGALINRVNGDHSQVLPAGYAPSAPTTTTIHKSDSLDEQMVQGIVQDGTVLACPQIIAYERQNADLFLGQEMPFVTSFQVVKDKDGNESTTRQPVVTKIPVGVSLSLNGTLNRDEDLVELQFVYDYSEAKEVPDFTFETESGPVKVQQPSFTTHGVQATLMLPVEKTVAVSGGAVWKTVTKRTAVPVLGKIPYVGGLFKNVSAARVSVTPLILIRCEVVDEASLLPPETDASNDTLPQTTPTQPPQ